MEEIINFVMLFPKLVKENDRLRVDFPSRIWEIWTGSDRIRASQILEGNGWLMMDFPSSRIWEIWTFSPDNK